MSNQVHRNKPNSLLSESFVRNLLLMYIYGHHFAIFGRNHVQGATRNASSLVLGLL